MIILGHKYIKSEPFYLIKKSEDIVKTPSNSVVMFEFNKQTLDLCYYCKENSVKYAVIADNVKDVLFASCLDASYIICDKVLSPKAGKIAEQYLFDSKVLLYSSEDDDLEWVADIGIDGIIFEEGVNYGSC